MKNLLLLAVGAALPLASYAQLPTTYAQGRDSLWQRASRIRLSAAARTRLIKSAFPSIGGTRRNIKSYSLYKPDQPLSHTNPYQYLKREVVKHKTHGAQVRKVYYFGVGGRLRLYEYYEDGQLVQLELPDYLVADGTGVAGQHAVCTMRWLRGDYLSIKLKPVSGPTERRAYARVPDLPQ